MSRTPPRPIDVATFALAHAADRRGHAAAYERLHARGELIRGAWFWRWLLDRLDAPPGARLLDVACGDGALIEAASARGLRAVGVDRSAAALRAAARSPRRAVPVAARPALVCADGEGLPFPDAAFDVVTSIGSLEHYVDPRVGAAELARVLGPRGRALVLLPNAFGLRGPVLHAWRRGELIDDGQPIQRYAARRQWQRLLEAGGLAVAAVLGCESLAADPSRPAAWLGALRHPSRVLSLVHDRLPVDMAVELVFVCRKPSPRAGDG